MLALQWRNSPPCRFFNQFFRLSRPVFSTCHLLIPKASFIFFSLSVMMPATVAGDTFKSMHPTPFINSVFARS